MRRVLAFVIPVLLLCGVAIAGEEGNRKDGTSGQKAAAESTVVKSGAKTKAKVVVPADEAGKKPGFRMLVTEAPADGTKTVQIDLGKGWASLPAGVKKELLEQLRKVFDQDTLMKALKVLAKGKTRFQLELPIHEGLRVLTLKKGSVCPSCPMGMTMKTGATVKVMKCSPKMMAKMKAMHGKCSPQMMARMKAMCGKCSPQMMAKMKAMCGKCSPQMMAKMKAMCGKCSPKMMAKCRECPLAMKMRAERGRKMGRDDDDEAEHFERDGTLRRLLEALRDRVERGEREGHGERGERGERDERGERREARDRREEDRSRVFTFWGRPGGNFYFGRTGRGFGPRFGPRFPNPRAGMPPMGGSQGMGRAILDALHGIQAELRGLRSDVAAMHAHMQAGMPGHGPMPGWHGMPGARKPALPRGPAAQGRRGMHVFQFSGGAGHGPHGVVRGRAGAGSIVVVPEKGMWRASGMSEENAKLKAEVKELKERLTRTNAVLHSLAERLEKLEHAMRDVEHQKKIEHTLHSVHPAKK